MAIVYVVFDPETGEIRYVGNTSGRADRIKAHQSAARTGRSTPLYDWWRDRMRNGFKPCMLTIESFKPEHWDPDDPYTYERNQEGRGKIDRLEKHYIRKYGADGRLFNIDGLH